MDLEHIIKPLAVETIRECVRIAQSHYWFGRGFVPGRTSIQLGYDTQRNHSYCRAIRGGGVTKVQLQLGWEWNDTARAKRLDVLRSWLAGPPSRKAMWRVAQQWDRLGRPENYHHEYRAYLMDPEIGAHFSLDPKVHAMTTICHEMAHAVQFSLGRLGCGANHGTVFQKIYREFRREIVNPHLRDSEMLYPPTRQAANARI